MVPSSLAIRTSLLLLQLGLWIACNASENPTRRMTLSLFPGGDDTDVTTTDRATSLTLRNLSIPSEDGNDVTRVSRDQLASIAPVPLSSAAGAGSGQPNQSLSRCARQAHPPFEAQNSLPSTKHAQRSECFFPLLPAGMKDRNRKASPTRAYAYEQNLSNNDPASSRTEANASLQPGMNPSKLSATQAQMTASISTGQKNQTRSSVACLSWYPGSRYENEHHHPQRDAEDVNLLIINQLKRDLYAKASSRNSLNRSSQNFFVNSAKFSVGQVGPSTSLNHAVEPEQQQVKLKITDIVKFDANVFEQGRTIPEEFKCQAKVDSILSVIESIKSFSRGDEQCQPSESHVEFVKKMINDYSHSPGSASRDSVVGDGAKTAGTPANKAAKKRAQQSKRTQWYGALHDKLDQNKSLWFELWKERTAGVEWPEITGHLKRIENNLAVLMIYIDAIGTIFRGYYPTHQDSIGDPSLSLLKTAIELVKPSIEDKSFLFHKFTMNTPYERPQRGCERFTFVWS
ncbi:hypothetical protein PSHT_10297 [Puccinia striiformis]|uniref:Uncharacterized protein n=1 Tax=Puccinia striiformis TaxID=27350 RepID=A0A2S4VAL9_9BASI|nr:hypothetical protein PSHT_10297 [Puccinia striiformis]